MIVFVFSDVNSNGKINSLGNIYDYTITKNYENLRPTEFGYLRNYLNLFYLGAVWLWSKYIYIHIYNFRLGFELYIIWLSLIGDISSSPNMISSNGICVM